MPIHLDCIKLRINLQYVVNEGDLYILYKSQGMLLTNIPGANGTISEGSVLDLVSFVKIAQSYTWFIPSRI
jgi:hypothetical protein